MSSDKTDQATTLAYSLIQDLPKKEERLEAVKQSAKLSQFSEFPNFRNITMEVEEYINLGFTEDPNRKAFTEYDSMTFEDIYKFYESNIKYQPTFLGIYGNSKKIDLKSLEKIGTVKKVKKEEVMKL